MTDTEVKGLVSTLEVKVQLIDHHWPRTGTTSQKLEQSLSLAFSAIKLYGTVTSTWRTFFAGMILITTADN